MATPTTTIDALPAAAGDLSPADLVIVQQSGVTKKATVAQVGAGTVSDVIWVGPDAPSDATIELWYDTDATTSTEMGGDTIDTGEAYRIVMFSDGTVRAIPVAAEEPDVPTGLARVVRISSVKLTWTAATGAASYIIYRDDVQIATTTNTRYRDANVTVGSTYDYNIVAVSSYLLRSGHTADVTAFIDPALNVTPVVEVRTYPATSIALGNRAVVRVNALDVDGQLLAVILGVDVGTLVATADPTVWYLEPA